MVAKPKGLFREKSVYSSEATKFDKVVVKTANITEKITDNQKIVAQQVRTHFRKQPLSSTSYHTWVGTTTIVLWYFILYHYFSYILHKLRPSYT